MMKQTILNADEATDKFNSGDLTGYQKVLMREYAGLLSSVEFVARQYLPNLLNPNAQAKTDEWRQVQELASKLAFKNVNQNDLARIAEIEKQLTDMGVIQ